MDERIASLLEPLERLPGASEEVLERLRQTAGGDLPADYVEFLRWSNGAVGTVRPALSVIAEQGVAGSDLRLFSAELVLELTGIFGQLWPGYLVLGGQATANPRVLVDTFLLLLDTRAPQGGVAPFAVADVYPEEGTDGIEFRTHTFYELLVQWSCTCAVLPAGAELHGVNLRGARLYHAVLFRANLAGADLTGADLRNAELSGADLRGANLTSTQLFGINYDEETRWPEGFDPRQHGLFPWE
jgi:hypothetical protein